MDSPPILTAAPDAPLSRGIPFLRLGFRPFYLGAAVFAPLSVPLWVAMALGKVLGSVAVAREVTGRVERKEAARGNRA